MKPHSYCGFIAFFKKILYNEGKNIKKITRGGDAMEWKEKPAEDRQEEVLTPEREEELQREYGAYVDRMRLMDDTFFHACMKDYPEGVEIILRIVLQDEAIHIVAVHTQDKQPNLYGREAWLDVFALDDRATAYDLEMQRGTEGAVEARARFHSGLMNATEIAKGTKWKALRNLRIVFFVENNPLAGNHRVYHVFRTVQELDGARFEDGEEILYVNCSDSLVESRKAEPTDALDMLVHDIRCADSKEMRLEVLRRRVDFFKDTKRGRMEMCKIAEELLEKGREEGLGKGIEKGREGMANEIASDMLKSGMAVEVVAKFTKLPISRIEELRTSERLA